jgi:hypothetical protein
MLHQQVLLRMQQHATLLHQQVLLRIQQHTTLLHQQVLLRIQQHATFLHQQVLLRMQQAYQQGIFTATQPSYRPIQKGTRQPLPLQETFAGAVKRIAP